ncbi:MAG: ABC-F family ATP-binding cassette domain-containing protein [bacterium]
MNITFNNVSFKYGEKNLLTNISTTFRDDRKTALVGKNGSGKTTMLKLIAGKEKPNSGEIIISGKSKINYLDQEPVFPKDTKIVDLFNNIEDINEYEIKSILNKFKLTNHELVCNNLSGGEKKRLALAICLVKQCDMLVLDEPTNHLDIDMILFLEKFLNKWNKGLILITHDRYFLDVVCNQIIEIKNNNVYAYDANYSKYLELRKITEQELLKEQQKHKKTMIEEEAWASRQPKARTTKSKSRLDRFEELQNKTFETNNNVEFNSIKTRLGKKLIEIIDGSKSFDKPLFNNFNLSLLRSDTIGFIGKNGSGKSTLFKIIMGLEQLDAGEIILGETLRIGYLTQEVDVVDNEITLMDYLNDVSNEILTTDGVKTVSYVLEQFNFDKEQHYSKLKFLSGGEKRRLQLVKVLIQNPNLLILDEPTNDLDINTLDSLEEYLETFIGPILIVSHDRYFLDNTCNKLCVFENNNISITNDSYTDYLNKFTFETNNKSKGDTRVAKVKMSSKDRNLLEELEKEIPLLEEKLDLLKKDLNKLTSEYTQIMELTTQIEELSLDINIKTEKYFELLELKESLS